MNRSTAQRGFTLVEILVAMTIFSMVMLATVTGLRTLANTQGAVERMTGRVDEVRAVSGFLRDTMETAIVSGDARALALGGGGGDETMYFRFEQESFEWKSTILFGEAFGGTHIVRVAREGDQLVLRWQEPNEEGLPEEWEGTPSRALVHDLEEFAVLVREEYEGEWQAEWKKVDPPALVRLQLKTAGRYWPDLILAVQR